MPTAAKLSAAIWFALLAWFAAELSKGHMDDNMRFGAMSLICAGFGAVIGWVFLGRRAGAAMQTALGFGLTASALMAFWSVFYFAFEQMIHRSWDQRYRDAAHALNGFGDLFVQYGAFAVQADVLATLVVGGLFGGWLTEKVSQKWS